MAYIGLDVGTSGCKAAVLEESGEIRASAAREYPFVMPRQGYVELDPRAVRQAVFETLRAIAPRAADARALAVSSIGEAMVLLDARGEPLANGIVYLDERCKPYPEAICARIGERALFDETLVPLNQMYSLNKILWYRDNRPELLEQARKFFLFGDYITYLLCGARAIDAGSASRTMFLDARHSCWSRKLTELFGLPTDRFSEILPVGTVLGPLLPAAAEQTGLPQTLRVVLGAHDQVAATLGAGCVKAGDCMLGEGTSESLNLLVRAQEVAADAAGSGFGYEPFVEPGLYLIPVAQSTHGICIRWFTDLFARDYLSDTREGEKVYAAADRLCAADARGLLFLPYLSRTCATDAASRAPGVFLGLDLASGRDEMYRAVLEGLAFETRAMAELLRRYSFAPEKITAAGGGARSGLFMQIKADVLGTPLSLLENAESGIAGLGMICAVACGDCGDYAEAAGRYARIRAQIRPRNDRSADYARYRAASTAVKALCADKTAE